MLPDSNRNQGIALVLALAVGWLLILAYFVMPVTNLISALQDGASGTLLARVFSFGGLGSINPGSKPRRWRMSWR